MAAISFRRIGPSTSKLTKATRNLSILPTNIQGSQPGPLALSFHTGHLCAAQAIKPGSPSKRTFRPQHGEGAQFHDRNAQ